MRNCFDQTLICEHPTKINQFVGEKEGRRKIFFFPKSFPPSSNILFLRN
jgi:hypothetical protein